MSTLQFSTREIAAGVWLLILFVWLLSRRPSVKSHAVDILRLLLDGTILIFCVTVLLATCVSVLILNAIGFWELGLLKETVYWFLFSAFAIAGGALTEPKNGAFPTRYIQEHLRIIVILEAVIAAHTFPLVVEFILVPSVTIVALTHIVSETRPKYSRVKTVFGRLLATFGFAILLSAVWNISTSPTGPFDKLLMRQALLPLLLSILLAPAAIGISLYSAYEHLFIPLRIGPEKPLPLQRRAKWALLWRLGLRPRRVWTAARVWRGPLIRLKSEQDLRNLLKSGLSADFP